MLDEIKKHHRGKILIHLKNNIKEIKKVESGGGGGRNGSIISNYLIVELNNKSKKEFEYSKYKDDTPHMTEYEKEISIKIEDFPIVNDVFYSVVEFICKEFSLSIIERMTKQLKIFESILNDKITELNSIQSEVRLINDHMKEHLYYWGYVDKIETIRTISKNESKSVTTVKFLNGMKRNLDTSFSNATFEGFEQLDSYYCRRFSIIFISLLQIQSDIEVPEELKRKYDVR